MGGCVYTRVFRYVSVYIEAHKRRSVWEGSDWGENERVGLGTGWVRRVSPAQPMPSLSQTDAGHEVV